MLLLLLACSDYKIEDRGDNPDGDAPDIAVEPEVVEFGTVEVGCGVDTQVRVSNVGLSPLEVTSITWGGSTDITGDAPTFTLEPGASTLVNTRYLATVAGRVDAEMAVHSNDPDEATLAVPLFGSAVSAATTDRYVQRTPEVDVLWVVDNSGSMSEEQARVIADIQSFFTYFEALGLDYHMGVITTDVVTPTMGGRLQGSPAFITPDTPNAAAELAEALAVGTEDQGNESGLAALQLALSEPVLSVANAGFIRESAQLVVAILTDEPEQSGVASADYIAFLTDFKADPTFMNVSAIVGDYGVGCSTTCSDAPQTAQPGDAYIDVALAFPGVFGSICECSLAPTLDQIGLDGTLFTRRFVLSALPADPSAIEVLVEGVAATGWAYDAGSNSVVFDAPPASGALVDITYDTFPECD